MAYKILERALCPDCEKLFTDAHIVHKEVPYSQGTAQCERCHKKRYCTRYKVRIGKADENEH